MNIKWLAIASGVMLLFAIPSGIWPYGYYILLRWVVFISSIVIASGFHEFKLSGWALVFGMIALLFNPLIPFYLNKSSWVLVDIVSATLFFLAAFSIKKKEENLDK